MGTVQTHHHTTTCRKRKGVRCRFYAPWPPTETTVISRNEGVDKEQWTKSKQVLDKVLDKLTGANNLQELELSKVLESCEVSQTEYENALLLSERKLRVLYKRKPDATFISPYNPILLSAVKSNMNLQYVTGVYGLLAYLSAY